MEVLACDSSVTTCTVPNGFSSPSDGRGLDLRWGGFLCCECFWTQRGENRIVQTWGVKGVGAHVLTLPLMWWYLGRQGSSGKGSWENTESSPEEQELRVSGKLGEYCSDGMQRSRYSCKKRISLEDLSERLKKSLWLTGDGAVIKLRDFPEDCERVLFSWYLFRPQQISLQGFLKQKKENKQPYTERQYFQG